jgi:hypothetical protein
LIDDESGQWNEENVGAFFTPDVVAKILQVPISRHAGDDFACWPFTRHGLFSVRSAYNLSRSSKFFRTLSSSKRGLPSNWSASERDWKAIWKVKAPGKMNIHLWRFSHDCLPRGSNSVRGMFQRLVTVYSVIDLKALSMLSCFVSLQERFGEMSSKSFLCS